MVIERVREVVANGRDVVRRAFQRRGYERETVVVIAKSVIASTGAWIVGFLLGNPTQIGFAPFSALLVVTPTVYGSVLQSGRYVAAVFLGALIAGAGGITIGVNIWLFALIVLVALLVGQFSFFRDQGKQIPVVAAFALAGGTAGSFMSLGTLLLMVLVGTTIAVVTNMVFAPTIRFRDAENAVLDFAESLCDLTREMADGFREGGEGLDDADSWARVADGFDSTARNAQASVSEQESRARLNPRRLLDASVSKQTPNAYYAWILALSRSSRHVQSLIRTLRSTKDAQARFPEPSGGFMREFAPLLDGAADAFRAIRAEGEPDRDTVSSDLDHSLQEGLRLVDHVRRNMSEHWDDERWPVHSAMITDMERVFEELREGHENTEGDASRGAAE
ncbi:FUSC family protein [Nocardiopsis halotolerans]|uniref:FUSC family protein n=1 Tax=Nocardiopsis halotolerans TaxID=124252 RepID=UPI00038284B3|nr:aromatic acid exporter family protein [Nocardiopsis halotolerans]